MRHLSRASLLLLATVVVKDDLGNPIAGSYVTIEATGTENTIVQPVGVTGVDGTAVGSVKSTKAEQKTISARADGLYLTATASVTFVSGPFSPSVSTLSVDKATIVANGVDSVQVTVVVKDALGNPIAGSSVWIEATGTENTIVQPVGVTGVDGTAVGSVKSPKAELKTISARVGGTLVTTALNVSFVQTIATDRESWGGIKSKFDQ